MCWAGVRKPRSNLLMTSIITLRDAGILCGARVSDVHVHGCLRRKFTWSGSSVGRLMCPGFAAMSPHIHYDLHRVSSS